VLDNWTGPAFPPQRERDYRVPPEMGSILADLLGGGSPQSGPPWTHTIVPSQGAVFTRSGKLLYRPPAAPWFTIGPVTRPGPVINFVIEEDMAAGIVKVVSRLPDGRIFDQVTAVNVGTDG